MLAVELGDLVWVFTNAQVYTRQIVGSPTCMMSGNGMQTGCCLVQDVAQKHAVKRPDTDFRVCVRPWGLQCLP